MVTTGTTHSSTNGRRRQPSKRGARSLETSNEGDSSRNLLGSLREFQDMGYAKEQHEQQLIGDSRSPKQGPERPEEYVADSIVVSNFAVAPTSPAVVASANITRPAERMAVTTLQRGQNVRQPTQVGAISVAPRSWAGAGSEESIDNPTDNNNNIPSTAEETRDERGSNDGLLVEATLVNDMDDRANLTEMERAEIEEETRTRLLADMTVDATMAVAVVALVLATLRRRNLMVSLFFFSLFRRQSVSFLWDTSHLTPRFNPPI